MTLGIDIGVIKRVITHAAAVHGLDISPDPVDLARVALKRLGLIGKRTKREAHDMCIEIPPTSDLDAIPAHFEQHMRQGLKKTMGFIGSF